MSITKIHSTDFALKEEWPQPRLQQSNTEEYLVRQTRYTFEVIFARFCHYVAAGQGPSDFCQCLMYSSISEQYVAAFQHMRTFCSTMQRFLIMRVDLHGILKNNLSFLFFLMAYHFLQIFLINFLKISNLNSHKSDSATSASPFRTRFIFEGQ